MAQNEHCMVARDISHASIVCPSFLTTFCFPTPTHQHHLLEAYILDCLIQESLPLCSFIGCPALSRTQLFFFLLGHSEPF